MYKIEKQFSGDTVESVQLSSTLLAGSLEVILVNAALSPPNQTSMTPPLPSPQAFPSPFLTSLSHQQLAYLRRRALPSRGQCFAMCAAQSVSAFFFFLGGGGGGGGSKSQPKYMLTVISVLLRR